MHPEPNAREIADSHGDDMGGGFERPPGKQGLADDLQQASAAPTPGKRTLVQTGTAPDPVQLVELLAHGPDVVVQREPVDHGYGDVIEVAREPAAVQRAAAQGVAGAGGRLPYGGRIQALFGHHDVGGIEAHLGGEAANASRAIGAEAYATGNHVAFASSPSLHTAAHEAAHVVQQRGGVQLKGGVGEVGDAYEQHADQVADAVVRGESAEGLLDRHAAGTAVTPTVQLERSPAGGHEAHKPSRNLSEIAKTAIDELDGDASKKVLLQTVLSAARLHELPAFTELLKAAPHKTYGDHFIFLINELHEDYGSQVTVSILQEFAAAGINIAAKVDTYDLQPLAAVATFKVTLNQFKALYLSGDLSDEDQRSIGILLREAENALRSIEGPPRKEGRGPHVKLAGVAGAAVAAWQLAGALAADDVTAVGVADDVAIPFVVVGAIVLTGIAAFTAGPKPTILDYAPARKAVDAALRQMTDLLAISSAMAIQGRRARGQVGNIAAHLARLLVLSTVGGQPPEEPPKKNDDNDNHWWSEIKASLKSFLQATKGASRKQILRELLKEYSEAQIAEIEAALARAEQMMGENIGRILPPP